MQGSGTGQVGARKTARWSEGILSEREEVPKRGCPRPLAGGFGDRVFIYFALLRVGDGRRVVLGLRSSALHVRYKQELLLFCRRWRGVGGGPTPLASVPFLGWLARQVRLTIQGTIQLRREGSALAKAGLEKERPVLTAVVAVFVCAGLEVTSFRCVVCCAAKHIYVLFQKALASVSKHTSNQTCLTPNTCGP